MKPILVAMLLAAGLMTAHAQASADDRYLGIYGLMNQAKHLAATGEPGEALAAYTDAERQLQQFKNVYPDWGPAIVSFRLKQMAEKISELKAQVSASAKGASSAVTNSSAAANPTPATSQANAELTRQLDRLQVRLQAQLAANEKLQARLKEALSVQPAAVDPRELAAAREKIRWLMKENDLLKASHGVGQTITRTLYATNTVKVYVTNNPVVVTNLAAAFEKKTTPQIVTNFVRVVVEDTNAMAILRSSRAEAVKHFNEEHDRAERLADELEKLRQAAASASSNAAPGTNATAFAALQTDNASLRHELEVLRAAQAAAAISGNQAVELNQARAQIAKLQAAARINALEKLALERKLKEALASTNTSVASVAYETRIRELSQERDDLLKQLHAASPQNSGGGNSALTAQVASLTSQVATLRSQLAALEAQPSPYTADELALFKSAAPAPAKAVAGEKSIKEMPDGTAELVATAQQHFARGEFGQAEADYQKILSRDQNNGIALANLATIELQEGKLAQAEKHITAALAKSPNDPYNLSTLGYLRMRQEKYDAAFDVLSRAAQLDPNDPEIQNYLGVTLGHLGQRRAAEAALRRAIQINPSYAPAHNNLAVIYLNQKPPLPELARWHYLKAIAAGMPHNPGMEKMLAEKGAPVQ